MKGFLIVVAWSGFFILTLKFIVDILAYLKKRHMDSLHDDVLDYLIMNRNDLIDLYKSIFKLHIKIANERSGFLKQETVKNLSDKIRKELRGNIMYTFSINTEEAMLLEAEEDINKCITYIIDGSIK